MKVLAEILKLWHRDGHRVLIFVQTVQMLEILELWMSRVGYTHSRIDGKTPVKRRLKLIEDFNEKNDLFAMLLTTRVGGVGLNIIGTLPDSLAFSHNHVEGSLPCLPSSINPSSAYRSGSFDISGNRGPRSKKTQNFVSSKACTM